MGDLTSRHDAFIRAIMGNQAIALDYFKACLPEHIVKKLDFSTLTQLPDTYVSKELRKTVRFGDPIGYCVLVSAIRRKR